MARSNGSSDINYVERCEAEAAAAEKREGYARPVTLMPMEEWDRAVAERMDRDQCSRDCAVDRLLATAAGSALWGRACTWDAAQPKVVIENGREVRSGNWGSSGFATLRRVPRRP
jgi:hypothetical protein